jgi:Flp pilus assembly protein TadD
MTDLTLAEIVDRAQRLLLESRDTENLEFLEAAITRFPNDPEVRLLFATALIPFRPEEAPWQVARALELDPDDPWRLTRAASIMFNLDELEASRSYVARATKLAPPDFALEPELANLGGRLAALDGDDALAEEALRTAFEAEPTRQTFAFDLATFLAEAERIPEAITVLDRALVHGPGNEQLAELRQRLARQTE